MIRSSAPATGPSCGADGNTSVARHPRPAGVLPLHGRLHGHRRHDPHRIDGRAVEVEQLRRVGPLLRRHLLPAVRGVDLGRRLARQDLGHHGPRCRLRRLRRLRRRARRRWRRCARRPRIVLGPRIGKFGPDGKPRAIPGHNIPMAITRLLHPAVRLVRLQRRLDLRGDRHPVRHGGDQHRDRCGASAPRSPCSTSPSGPASPTPA